MNRYDIVQYPSGQALLLETMASNGQKQLQRVVEVFQSIDEARSRLARMQVDEAETAVAVG